MSDEARETVSTEAHERVKRENAELKAKLDEVSTTLTDMAVREKTRSALKGKVADPDTAADFFLPHLRGTEVDKIGETLESDRFTSMMTLMSGAPQPASSEASAEAAPPPDPGPQTSFAGPNPGAGGGPTPQPDKIDPRDTVHMSREQVEDLQSKGLIAWSSENPDDPIPIMRR